MSQGKLTPFWVYVGRESIRVVLFRAHFRVDFGLAKLFWAHFWAHFGPLWAGLDSSHALLSPLFRTHFGRDSIRVTLCWAHFWAHFGRDSIRVTLFWAHSRAHFGAGLDASHVLLGQLWAGARFGRDSIRVTLFWALLIANFPKEVALRRLP